MQRRLTTLVAADLVGYSRLMAADEEGTANRLRHLRDSVILPGLAAGEGRLIKTMGDGLLAEFPSPVAAVRTVTSLLAKLAAHEADQPEDRRMRFRVGVNLGDVIIDGDDVLGDGVNIAARLESLAPPGGLCISRSVHDQVRGKVEAEFTSLGPQMVKNIPDPVEVWRAELATTAPVPKTETLRPTIAILPFDNMSSDPDQEFLADGIVEDVITELSRFRALFVIARNSTFAYKGTHKDIRQIARELDVRYVVEGSVRRAGNRLRVTAQLIEAETGRHIWADRWDRTMEDLFDLQDELTRAIVSCIEPELGAHERAMARAKPTDNLTAWELYQRANAAYLGATEEGYVNCMEWCTRAIEIDPNFALPHSLLGRLYWYRLMTRRASDVEAEIRTGLFHCHRAIEIDDREELGWVALTCVLSYAGREADARAALKKAEALNPNNAIVSLARCIFSLHQSKPEAERMEASARKALSQSPRDPNAWAYQAFIGHALLIKHGGMHATEVREAYEASAAYENAESFTPFICAMCNVAQGRTERAKRYLDRALEMQPDLNLSNWLVAYTNPLVEFINSRHRAELESLVAMGLPRE